MELDETSGVAGDDSDPCPLAAAYESTLRRLESGRAMTLGGLANAIRRMRESNDALASRIRGY